RACTAGGVELLGRRGPAGLTQSQAFERPSLFREDLCNLRHIDLLVHSWIFLSVPYGKYREPLPIPSRCEFEHRARSYVCALACNRKPARDRYTLSRTIGCRSQHPSSTSLRGHSAQNRIQTKAELRKALWQAFDVHTYWI